MLCWRKWALPRPCSWRVIQRALLVLDEYCKYRLTLGMGTLVHKRYMNGGAWFVTVLAWVSICSMHHLSPLHARDFSPGDLASNFLYLLALRLFAKGHDAFSPSAILSLPPVSIGK